MIDKDKLIEWIEKRRYYFQTVNGCFVSAEDLTDAINNGEFEKEPCNTYNNMVANKNYTGKLVEE